MLEQRRYALPRCNDRLRLGRTGLRVSPLCLGMTMSPDVVPAAYEAGINFFFITADLHWPLYEHTRAGLSKLLTDNKARRDEIVVGVVSYLDEPLFGALQFHEVIDSVPGLERVDVLIAGGVASDESFYPRLRSITNARAINHSGSSAIGASFHQRSTALTAANYNLLDIMFTRYNSAHPGARTDLFPYLHPQRAVLNYNFKSVLSLVTKEMFTQLGLTDQHWLPHPSDYYRFVLTRPEIDGILCSPCTPKEVEELVAALDKGPLRADEEEYMIWLSSIASPKYYALT